MIKWQNLFLLLSIFIASCSRQERTEKVFSGLCFIDHQNLRYVENEETVRFQVGEIKKNLDRAEEYGIGTYLFFAKETFEAMLNYDFEIEGLGNIGSRAFPVAGELRRGGSVSSPVESGQIQIQTGSEHRQAVMNALSAESGQIRIRSGTEHRKTGKYLRKALHEVLEYAKRKNLRVFFHSNQFIFPDEVLDVIKPAVWGTAVCPGKEITWEIYRKKLNEFLSEFPDIAGFQVTGDETQVSVLECRCESCRQLSFVDRVNLLTRETARVCQEHGKEVQMRTWQRMGELEKEMHPSRMGEGLPENVFFSIKNTNGDFHMPNPVDEKFLHAADPDRIVVEFDAWREYDGNNYFPCYMGDIWAPRFRLLDELGVKRAAVRLNWNSSKNPIFDRPWGNAVNIYLFLGLAENPERPPDEILTRYISNIFPESAHTREAAFEMYKFSTDFQRTIYYIRDGYCANHSKVQDEDAREDLNSIGEKGFLTKEEHFKERREEIEAACKKALAIIGRMGSGFPESWRQEMTEGINVERYVALATIYKMEAIFWKEKNDISKSASVKNRISRLQNEWRAYHPESYQSMNGDDAGSHF